MNLVIHGGGGILEVELSPDLIQIIARDQGRGYQMDLAMQEGYSTAPPRCGRWALAQGWVCPMCAIGPMN